MALENGTYVNSLVTSNPASTDGIAQADDHLRLIKSTIKNTFPNLHGAVTATVAQLNSTASMPSSLTDLSISDGSANQVLKTDGNGNFSFVSLPAGTTDTNYYVTGGSVSGTVLTLNRQGLGNINIGGLPTAITNNNQLANGAGYITSSQASSPTSTGAVGTYALLYDTGTSIVTPGTSRSGSSLRYANVVSDVNGVSWFGAAPTSAVAAPGGTWRCMGTLGYAKESVGATFSIYFRGTMTTLFLRIS